MPMLEGRQNMDSASSSPILNRYKLDYVFNRVPQTLFGGLRLKLSFRLPVYIYLNQIIVWFVPALLASIFSILAEIDPGLVYIVSCVYGLCMVLFVAGVSLIPFMLHRKANGRGATQPGRVLTEDDEIIFSSCCSTETVHFMFHRKKHILNIVVLSLLSGGCSGLLFLYILPSRTQILFGSLSYSITYYVVAWLLVCSANYAVTGQPPPEPAQFKSSSFLEIDILTRMFHLTVFGLVGLVARFNSGLEFVDYICHILVLTLPLLWLLGFLPPISALYSWVGDQALIFLFGGSAMGTDVRLTVMLIISLISCWIISVVDVTMVPFIASLLGFATSLDLCTYLEWMVERLVNLCCLTHTRHFNVFHSTLSSNRTKNFAWPLRSKQSALYISCAVVLCAINVCIVAVINRELNPSEMNDLYRPFCYALIAFKVLHLIASDLALRYFAFGIVLNPLHKRSINGEVKSKPKELCQDIAILVNKGLSLFVLPVLLSVTFSVNPQRGKVSFFIVILIFRAYRRIWQETSLCSTDVLLVFIINDIQTSLTWWNEQSYYFQLFLVSLFYDRIYQLLRNCYFAAILSWRFYFISKQRHEQWKRILAASFALSPVLIVLFVLGVALASPLLPFFTLPLFLMGFPRPGRFWSNTSTPQVSSSADWIYYESVVSDLHYRIVRSLQFGAISSFRNGDFYLGRFQDRLFVVSILEKGFSHINYTLKGLELQETSCHTAEAAVIDDIFDISFMSAKDGQRKWYNTNFWHVLTPMDLLCLTTYSDAKNVLTGIIENPETLAKVDSFFFKTLTWVLVRYCWHRKREGPSERPQSTDKRAKTSTSVRTKVTGVSAIEESKVEAWGLQNVANSSISGTSTASKDSTKSCDSDRGLLPLSSASRPQPTKRNSDLKSEKAGNLAFPALDSKGAVTSAKFGAALAGPRLLDDDDDLDDFGFDDDEFDIPKKISINGECRDKEDDSEEGSLHSLPIGSVSKLEKREAGVSLTPLSSVHSKTIEPPHHWTTLCPIEPADLASYKTSFPRDWYRLVLSSISLDTDAANALESICSDQGLESQFEKLILSCHYIVEIAGLYGASPGPSHVHSCFCGAIPWSHYANWLEEDEELKALTIKAYRYAVKLAYDEAVVGDLEGDEELKEYLTSFDEHWYMGTEEGKGWAQAVLDKKPFLFHLGKDKENNTYTSRVLTMQETRIPFGQLNSECVRGIWASLALELLYFTNDDEERYSIQAHPHLLRNIITQAADPPLGYPVYSSGLMKGWGI